MQRTMYQPPRNCGYEQASRFENCFAEHFDDQLLVEQVFDHYHETLLNHSDILGVLSAKKVSLEIIKEFRLGYANRTLGFALSSTNPMAASHKRGSLQRYGLLKPSGHEFFRGAIVFPCGNGNRSVVAAYGRRPFQQRRSPVYDLYWNTSTTPLFNHEALSGNTDILLCKNSLDALSLVSLGFSNAVAVMGMQGFNSENLQQLLRSEARHIIVTFGNTPLANQMALEIAQALALYDISCSRVIFPTGLDLGDYLQTHNDSGKIIKELIKTATKINPKNAKIFTAQTIIESVDFYLGECVSLGKTPKTIAAYRTLLTRFLTFCAENQWAELPADVEHMMDEYHQWLTHQLKISDNTRQACIQAVQRLVTRLERHQLIAVLTSGSAPHEAANASSRTH